MRIQYFGALAGGILLASCSFQRAQVAADAQTAMVGMTKEQVLACMGPPVNKATEGATEVWVYNSGNGQTDVATYASGNRFSAAGFGVASQRFCQININMNASRVAAVNYVGPTGGLISQGE